MLDQRRAKKQGYITLKEAAALADYTPDYVGQLIRAGKIKGKQVYSSVAWVTTEAEMRAYLEDKTRTVDTTLPALIEAHSRPYLMYSLIAIVAIALLLFQYVLYVSLDVALEKVYLDSESVVTLHIPN